MSKIKNGWLDQYGAGLFEQQQFGTAGVEGVKIRLSIARTQQTWLCVRKNVIRFERFIVIGCQVALFFAQRNLPKQSSQTIALIQQPNYNTNNLNDTYI